MNTPEPSPRWISQCSRSWDQFWFTPTAPHTLALIRILVGMMLFYSHLVWLLDLQAFVGPHSWISTDASRFLQEQNYTWTYLWYISSPTALLVTHLIGMAIFIMLALGIFTPITSVLSWFIAICYCHRLEGALFGLDQINVMLVMYLMISPSGDAYSIDRRRRMKQQSSPDTIRSVRANIAMRLMQIHLCIIYLFGGIGKMRGSEWWDGSASWWALANPEYQSLDMTWLAPHIMILSAITHVTVFWETFYCVLIWHRLTRPVMLMLAVLVHGSIALCMGMVTFGCIMLVANLAFIAPSTIDAWIQRGLPKGQGRGGHPT